MLRVRAIHSDRLRTVSVIESVESWHARSPARCQAMGRIEPIAVIIDGAKGRRAVDINGEAIDDERLARLLGSAASGQSSGPFADTICGYNERQRPALSRRDPADGPTRCLVR